MLKPLIVVVSIFLSCLGYGFFLQRILRFRRNKNWSEEIGISFAVGMGTMGWLLFWPGLFGLLSVGTLWIVVILGWSGLLLNYRRVRLGFPFHFDWVTILLIAGVGSVFVFGLLEATAPPLDADTLAYHYAIPKYFLENGGIEFIPIAFEGAIPLLVR